MTALKGRNGAHKEALFITLNNYGKLFPHNAPLLVVT